MVVGKQTQIYVHLVARHKWIFHRHRNLCQLWAKLVVPKSLQTGSTFALRQLFSAVFNTFGANDSHFVADVRFANAKVFVRHSLLYGVLWMSLRWRNVVWLVFDGRICCSFLPLILHFDNSCNFACPLLFIK